MSALATTLYKLHTIPGVELAAPRASATLADRVFAKIEVEYPHRCWTWTGATDHMGYGYVGRGGRGTGTIAAHRAVWELLIGPIPAGLTFDHLCRNPSCVNPMHGELVTLAENARRSGRAAAFAARTECNYGHPLDGITKSGRLRVRYCKTCARARSSARWRKSREGITDAA